MSAAGKDEKLPFPAQLTLNCIKDGSSTRLKALQSSVASAVVTTTRHQQHTVSCHVTDPASSEMKKTPTLRRLFIQPNRDGVI